MLEDSESSDFDMMIESMILNETFGLRQGPPPLPPRCSSPAKPNVTNVNVYKGPCTVTIASLGGATPAGNQPAFNISAPKGTKECVMKICADGPGTMAFIARSFPEDAQMTLIDLTGNVNFKKGSTGPVLVGVGRTNVEFRYASESGGAVFITVYTACFLGCHQITTLAPPDSGIIQYPPPNFPTGENFKPICEYWFKAPLRRKVQLKFSSFNLGVARRGRGRRGSSTRGCTRNNMQKMIFSKYGDRYLSYGIQYECGRQTGLKVTSLRNKMIAVITPDLRTSGRYRRGYAKFEYTVAV